MRVAYISPLPPVRSGIAHYSALLLPALAARFDVVAVVDQDEVDPQPVTVIRGAEYERRSGEFDAVVCQLGNNRHHEFAWNVANRGGAVVVLHDIVMHHLLVEMTIARGDARALESELTSMYGEAGRAIAEARARGIHDDLPNFLYPASERVAGAARHVIVHNRWAAERLRSNGISTPITVAPLPYSGRPSLSKEDRDRTRRELGFAPGDRVIGAFGFVTHAKRPDVIVKAFARAHRTRGDLRLLFVGDEAHNVGLDALASAEGLRTSDWGKTGFVSDEEFERYLSAVDRVVNLRYPSAGETSGPLFHAFAAGRPTAVSDYAQFADFPVDVVTRIPFDSEIESLTRFMLAELDLVSVAGAQRAWLESTGTLERAVEAYTIALEAPAPPSAGAPPHPSTGPMPLFPRLAATIDAVDRRGDCVTVSLLLSNEGDEAIRAFVYGEPPFVLFARAVSGGVPVATASSRLSGDLGSRGTTLVPFVIETDIPRFTLELRHGLGGVPDVERPAFFVGEVVS